MSYRFSLAGLLGALLVPQAVAACALVFPPDAAVRVGGEEVLLVWDPEQGKEHLIRYIDFRGDAAHFGFLVPTPTVPDVDEVRGDPFGQLFALYHRERGQRGGRSPRIRSLIGDGDGVEVLAEHAVAGHTATVLRANDSEGLDRWLLAHGYPSGPALESYARPYVERGWVLTAFKYDKQQPQAESAILRISFDTAQPFFPYAEPRGTRPPRPFRLSVLAPTAMRALLSRSGARGSRWGARVGFRDALSRSATNRILEGTGVLTMSDGLHLTTWDEPRSRRGREDLYFAAQPGARPIAPRIRTRIVPPRTVRSQPAPPMNPWDPPGRSRGAGSFRGVRLMAPALGPSLFHGLRPRALRRRPWRVYPCAEALASLAGEAGAPSPVGARRPGRGRHFRPALR